MKSKYLFSIFSLFLFACVQAGVEEKKPNVIIISVDDMRDWVGYLDGYDGRVYTPNIDRLASQGVAFTNAHTSATVCCPSRNAIMLGKRPSTTGLYNNQQWWKAVYPNEVTLPQHFKNNGYYSAGAGKVFHHTPGNNPPCSWNEFQEQVFDDPWNFSEWPAERYFLTYGYRGPIIPFPEWKPMNGIFPIRSELDWGPIPGKNEKDYGDVHVVNFARDFLNKEHDNPFFLALGMYRPHLPWHVPQKFFDMYPLDEIILPDVREDDLDDIPEAGQKIALATSRDFFQIRDEGKWKKAVQAYLASITFADEQVGAVLDALENSSYNKNTIVVFWSDHGWHLGEKQHWHKSSLWEVCTRIPFIIKVPGVTNPNSICNKPVDMVNVFPTLTSLCDLPSKPGIDGHDMTSLLINSQAEWNYPAITEIGIGNMAIRTQNWRYIRYNDGSEELYNRENDPNEWNNLANDEKLNEIQEKHQKWIPETFHESVPGKNTYYFDPYEYTYLHRETSVFIDGKK